MRCKECGKNLSDSCFYKGRKDKNVWTFKVCKKCISLKRKQDLAANKRESWLSEKVRLADEMREQSPKTITPMWVIRNLKRFGNCYVRKISKVNIPEAESLVGCKLKVRLSLKENDGYVIEVQK